MAAIGIIGGSGLENPDLFSDPQEHRIDTPYGEPSAPPVSGIIEGEEVVILSRHGREHTIPPSRVNNRANIHALKTLGCTHILATTAVGSLREQIGRGDLAILDQFIDFTRHRKISFYEKFEPHTPVHVTMAEPFSEDLRHILIEGCVEMEYRHHPWATVITIEGPRFSTRAESRMFRAWGADVINMSIAPECALANEAGIPYAAVAMSTDYDCWKQDEEPVTWEAVFEIFSQNVEKVTNLLVHAIPRINALDENHAG